ncbi:MAG: phage virion morphogenesis protein [Myxococcota bacterium]
MTGAALDIDLREYDRLQRAILGLSQTRFQDLMDAIGTEVESQTRRRIDEEKEDPEGTPWRPWSPEYAKTRGAHHSLLVNERHLMDSITHNVLGTELEVGSSLVYAGVHQKSRPYLGLSGENEADVLAVVDDFMRSRMRREGLR